MNAIGWGILFLVVGLLLTMTDLFGLTLGAPLAWLGVILVAAGLAMGVWHFVARRRQGSEPRRGGPIL